MIVWPTMLVEPAEEAGIKVLDDVTEGEFTPEEYPHWMVYCNAQLGRPMPSPSCHWHNAKIIAGILDEEIFEVTNQDLLDKGWA